jgi:hypothetical protein
MIFFLVFVDEVETKMKIYQHLSRIREIVADHLYIRAYLYQKGILSYAEYDGLTSDCRVRCQQLIEILYRQNPDQLPFCHFLAALKLSETTILEDIIRNEDAGEFS